MKHLLLTTIVAVLVVGCATTKQPEPSTTKALDISIHDAAADGNIEAVNQHLEVGADVNARENNKWTPLHNAAKEGHNEIAELLIAGSAEVNAKGDYGKTPLHRAAQEGYMEIVELLIAKGADVNATNMYRITPLDGAIQWNRTETADLLRKNTAARRVKNSKLKESSQSTSII